MSALLGFSGVSGPTVSGSIGCCLILELMKLNKTLLVVRWLSPSMQWAAVSAGRRWLILYGCPNRSMNFTRLLEILLGLHFLFSVQGVDGESFILLVISAGTLLQTMVVPDMFFPRI